jgi:plastocyanin domain-containing protein
MTIKKSTLKQLQNAGLICLTVAVVGGFFILLSNKPPAVPSTDNVSIAEDGRQTIDITAKVGYYPYLTHAQAGVDTVIQVNTKSTFDCSVALTIPQLNYNQMLPASGVTKIALEPQPSGTTITGICSMGMYSFQIKFI